jgi:hypothetical protein
MKKQKLLKKENQKMKKKILKVKFKNKILKKMISNLMMMKKKKMNQKPKL